jgi:hypothetical protein
LSKSLGAPLTSLRIGVVLVRLPLYGQRNKADSCGIADLPAPHIASIQLNTYLHGERHDALKIRRTHDGIV